MQGEQVVLTDMLQCRERRAQIQDTFIEQYHCPVISFCMNIPGPVKTNEQIRTAFDSGKNTLLLKLEQAQADIKNSIEIHEKTGDELLLAIDCPAEKIQKISQLRLKKHNPIGRLFDMDVIDTDGQKLSRPSYRKCIICGCQAQECARTRNHTVEEMQAKIEEMLGKKGDFKMLVCDYIVEQIDGDYAHLEELIFRMKS